MRDGWRRVRLGSVTENVIKRAPAVGEEFEYIDISSISRETKAVRGTVSVNSSNAPGRARQMVQPGDVLISTVRPNLNAVARVPAELTAAIASTGLCVLRESADVAPGYLFAVVRSDKFVEDMTLRATGSNYPAVTDRIIRDYGIELPPLEEQQRIVDLIGSLDDAIGAAEAQSQATKGLLASLQANIPPAPAFPLGNLLVGIDSGVSISSSEHATTGPRAQILKLSAVRPARFNGEECKPIDPGSLPDKALVSDGDLLMTRSNTPDRVGYVCVARDVAPNTYMPDLVWRLRFDSEQCTAGYLEHVLSSQLMRERITSTASGTSQSMKKVNKQGIAAVLLPMPVLAEQNEYVERAEAAAASLAASVGLAESLRATRSELLSVLLSGKHEIPESYDVDTAVQLEPAA